MVTSPRVAGVSPTMIRIVVVLPAPFGPRNPVTVPGWQTKSTSSTAVKPPYVLVSPSTLILEDSLSHLGIRRIGPGHRTGQTKVGGALDPGRLRARLPSA